MTRLSSCMLQHVFHAPPTARHGSGDWLRRHCSDSRLTNNHNHSHVPDHLPSTCFAFPLFLQIVTVWQDARQVQTRLLARLQGTMARIPDPPSPVWPTGLQTPTLLPVLSQTDPSSPGSSLAFSLSSVGGRVFKPSVRAEPKNRIVLRARSKILHVSTTVTYLVSKNDPRA